MEQRTQKSPAPPVASRYCCRETMRDKTPYFQNPRRVLLCSSFRQNRAQRNQTLRRVPALVQEVGMLPHEGWKHRAASQPHRRPAVAASPRALGKKGNARTARLGQPHAEAGCGPLLPAAPARRPRAARSRRRGAARGRPCGGGGSALAAGRGRAVGAALLTSGHRWAATHRPDRAAASGLGPARHGRR